MTDVVADPTDDGTLRPNIAPEPTRDHFEPLFTPQFPLTKTLPPDVDPDDPFSIWGLFFTPQIMQMIVNATNIRARHRTLVVSLSNQLAKTQLFRSRHRH
jgi:hypothetical protein